MARTNTPKLEGDPAKRVVCVECGVVFYSKFAGAKRNAAKYCSNRCFNVNWKRNNPEKVKEMRRKTHLKTREKDLEQNRRWWLKNRKKLKAKRAEYRKAQTPEKAKEYRKRYYDNHRIKERNRAYKSYYLGHQNPKGDMGWLRRARTTLRNAQRALKSQETPEACVSQRLASETDKTSPT